MSPHEIYEQLLASARTALTNTASGKAIELAMPLEANAFIDSLARNLSMVIDGMLTVPDLFDAVTQEIPRWGYIRSAENEPHIEDIISAEMSRTEIEP